MEHLIQRKDKGIKCLNKDKYPQAIKDFTYVIDAIDTEDMEPLILKLTCLLNRSICYLVTKEVQKSLDDANKVIEIYQKMRPEEEQLKFTPDQIRDDPLTLPLSKAYVARGRAMEVQGLILEALNEYSLANTLVPGEEGQSSIQRVLSFLGIPPLDQTDKDIQMFTLFLLHLLSEVNIVTALTNLLQFVKENTLSEEFVTKINKTGCSRVLYAVMQLYPDSEVIIDAAICCARYLAYNNVVDIWNGIPVLRYVIDNWKNSKNIMGDTLMLLQYAPKEAINFMAEQDFLPAITESLKLELTDEEIDAAYFVLYNISLSESMIVQLLAEDVMEKVFERKSRSGILLLQRMCQLRQAAILALDHGAFEWAVELLQQEPENKSMIASCFIVMSQMLNLADEENEDLPLTQEQKDKVLSYADKVFDIVVPIIMKMSKEEVIVSNAFSVLTFAAGFHPQKVTEHRLIRAASPILSLHNDSALAVQNIMAFLYACAEKGLINEIKEHRATLPAILNALKTHPQNQYIVERAVAIAIMCDHSNKQQLLAAALKQFNRSEILKSYISILNLDTQN